jgi:hypothetical protein
MTSCCPELDHARAELWRLLEIPTRELDPSAAFAAMRDATTEVRAVGCSAFHERALLLPVVLRLLLTDRLEPTTRENLQVWLDVSDDSLAPRTLRRAG